MSLLCIKINAYSDGYPIRDSRDSRSCERDLGHDASSCSNSRCPFTLRMDSPGNSILCALLTNRFGMASAGVESSMVSYNLSRGY